MSAFLITWRPSGEIEGSGWPEKKLLKVIARFTREGRLIEPWTFRAYRMAKEGDRVFLLRQGRRGHAVFGYGRISEIPKPFEGLVSVEFEGLVNPALEVFATYGELHKIPAAGALWRARSSGNRIPDGVAERLERLVVGRVPMKVDAIGGEDWTSDEIDLIVANYFDMLMKEAKEFAYVKAQHRQRLRAKLPNRTEGSIEFKHQNISAVLFEAGLPYIPGYKPRHNYQTELESRVHEYLVDHSEAIEETVLEFNSPPRKVPVPSNLVNVFVPPPTPGPRVRKDTSAARHGGSKNIDHAARDEANKKLGKAGEEFVVEVERRRLLASGRKDLAKNVEWVADIRGDGAGYDVLSFNETTGVERYIEVKTTNSGAEQPFLLTRNEVEFGRLNGPRFRIYRVFAFKSKPQIFVISGAPTDSLELEATEFRARLRPGK